MTRVAMLAPIAWRTPPSGYGPWEQVVATLTDALIDLGVEVTLYATGDSTTRAELRSVVAHGYEEDPSYDVKVHEALHIARVFEEADDQDIIHNHFDFLPLAWSRLVDTPVVTTIHGFSSPASCPPTAPTTTASTTWPSATPTATPVSPTRPRSTTASTSTRSHSSRDLTPTATS